MKRIFIALFIISIISCKTGSSDRIVKELQVDNAAIVSAHPLASEVGLKILKAGGNAIDAAIAVQFALAVVYPQAGNIGGGGFLMYRDNTNAFYALDYREQAPEAATETMYLDSLGNVIPNKSTLGFAAAGIPGTVDGMDQAFQRFSKLKDWRKLVEPAIQLARNGFYPTKTQVDEILKHQDNIKKYSPAANAFTQDISTDKKIVQEELAKTLEAIRDKGRYGFYTGWVADGLVKSMKENGGLIDHLDLIRYKSKWRNPSISYYRGYRVATMPLPSSAGILLPQMLEMLTPHNLSAKGFHSPDAIHLVAEVERRAYADRAMHMGDPDHEKVPLFNLMHSDYLTQRMSDYNPNKATPSSSIRGGVFFESSQTTHFSILDADGNAVSSTTTLNGAFGAKSMVPGLGFFLNNEMDDFSVKPGVPNMYGLVGGEINKIAPYKRMLSSMAPTIIDKNNKPFMILGSPGGSTIPTTVLQVVMNVLDFRMPLKEAVNAPRFHHQWLPDMIYMEENRFDDAIKNDLESKGHEVKERSKIGQVNAILIDKKGKITAVGDDRKDNSVSGY